MLQQIVQFIPSSFSVTPSTTLTVEVFYSAGPEGDRAPVSGLTHFLHFDSSELQIQSIDVSDTVQDVGGNVTQSSESDEGIEDGIAETDQVVSTGIFDINANFPNTEDLTATLYTVSFQVLDAFDGTVLGNTIDNDPPEGFDEPSAENITLELNTENDPNFTQPPRVTTNVNNIGENEPAGTFVGEVSAVDPDGDNEAITFEITAGNEDVDGDGTAAFTIDDEGVVTVEDTDDLQAGNTFNLDIIAINEEGVESNPVTFDLEVEATPREPPQFVGEPFIFEAIVPGEVQNGDEVGTVAVENPEGVSFEFIEGNTDVDDDGNAAFAIDDGEITITDVDDLQQSFDLTVEASNDAGSNQTGITIAVGDIFISKPFFADGSLTVAANARDGTEVFTVGAEVADPQLTFAITTGNTDVDGDGIPAFAIDDEGIVTVQDADDLEAGNTFNLDIISIINDEVGSDSVTFEVEVEATPEEPPQFVGAPFIFEAIVPGEVQDGDEVGTVAVENPEGVSFELIEGNTDVDGDGNVAFAIDDDGVVTINDIDDLESEFQLTVKATNEFGSKEANITIPFTIVDSFPVITPPDAPITISEDFQVGEEVFTVEATDPAGDEITFEITSGNSDVDGDGTAPFAIDDEGVVTIQDADDLEPDGTFNLEIVATNEQDLTDSETFEVEVTENTVSGNNAPQLQGDVFRIEEDLADGEVVGTVTIRDSDDGLENLIISISAGNTDVDGDGELPFAIDEQGQITVNDSGDLATEVGSTFSLTVEAVDPLGATGTGSVTVVENDPNVAQPPTVSTDVNDIGENEPLGTFVGQASVFDPDGETENFEFTLEGDLDLDGDGEDVFAINSEGEITVNDTDDLDFEQQESFTFNLTATEVGTPDELTGQTEVTVNVVEVQDEELSSDFNNDGFVNLDDLGVFASAFGSQQGEENFNPIADLTGDGLINLDDLGIFASEFG